MSELSLTGLRVVQEVAARGSFTAAAAALDYTQSAVSRQVATVEAAAGAPLFARGPRGVEPTPAGRVLLRHATEILERVDAAALELAGLRDRLEGRLAAGAFPTALAALVPRALAALRAAHPALEVHLREGGTPAHLRALRAGRIELAVVAVGDGLEAYDLDGLRATTVVAGRGLLVAVGAAHRLAGRGAVEPADLAPERWIVGHGDAPQFAAWPGLDPAPAVAFAVGDWPGRFGLVAAGLGVALVPEILRDAVPAGVDLLAVREPRPTRRDVLAVTRAAPSAAAAALVEALREAGDAMAATR